MISSDLGDCPRFGNVHHLNIGTSLPDRNEGLKMSLAASGHQRSIAGSKGQPGSY